jgi:hypothetical protein
MLVRCTSVVEVTRFSFSSYSEHEGTRGMVRTGACPDYSGRMSRAVKKTNGKIPLPLMSQV